MGGVRRRRPQRGLSSALPALLLLASPSAIHSMGGGGGGGGRTCPAEAPWFTGDPDFVGNNPMGAPLRGNAACVDGPEPLSWRPVDPVRGQDAVNIYGPMEAGFTRQQWSCLGDRVIPGGIDTLLAEHMLHFMCDDDSLTIMDECGGHATPYHYHERISCLYAPSENGHSTRVGTAMDGHGIYGANIAGGVPPTDLDICNGRTGVTPDSNGEDVYYYVITGEAPFTVGCYGPVATVEECRELYNTCGNGDEYRVETRWGADDYDLDCPCFDENGSNMVGQGRPAFLPPLDYAGISGISGAAVAPAPAPAPASDRGLAQYLDGGDGKSSGAALVGVVAVGAVAMAAVGVKQAINRRHNGKEQYAMPSLRNLWTERTYSRVATEEDDAEAGP